MDGSQTSKFAKVFSLESFPLYGIKGTQQRVYPYTTRYLCNVGEKECTPAMFVPHWLSFIESEECAPTLSIACVM